jgi:hypothetical protein
MLENKSTRARIAILARVLYIVKCYGIEFSNIKSDLKSASSIGRGPSPYQAAWFILTRVV